MAAKMMAEAESRSFARAFNFRSNSALVLTPLTLPSPPTIHYCTDTMKIFIVSLVGLLSSGSVGAWTVPEQQSRRTMLAGGAAAVLGALTSAPPPASAKTSGFKLGDPNSVVGREIRSFNGLVNEFKNTSLDGGLDASKLNEPSVPFTEFGQKMKDGKVEFVEFIAPNGDVAYVTFKPEKGKKSERIRIGQDVSFRCRPDVVKELLEQPRIRHSISVQLWSSVCLYCSWPCHVQKQLTPYAQLAIKGTCQVLNCLSITFTFSSNASME
jgi:hypothetical protein